MRTHVNIESGVVNATPLFGGLYEVLRATSDCTIVYWVSGQESQWAFALPIDKCAGVDALIAACADGNGLPTLAQARLHEALLETLEAMTKGGGDD